MATQAHSAQTRTRFYETNVFTQWPTCAQITSGKGPLEPDSLTIESIVALKRAFRLRKNSDFQRVRQHGRNTASRLLVLVCAPNNLPCVRVGIVVSKRISKQAVKRNYIKRLLAEAIRPQLVNVPAGWDIVISAKQTVVGAPLPTLAQDIQFLLRRARLFVSSSVSQSQG
jgi:ribonuclease P protein component